MHTDPSRHSGPAEFPLQRCLRTIHDEHIPMQGAAVGTACLTRSMARMARSDKFAGTVQNIGPGKVSHDRTWACSLPALLAWLPRLVTTLAPWWRRRALSRTHVPAREACGCLGGALVRRAWPGGCNNNARVRWQVCAREQDLVEGRWPRRDAEANSTVACTWPQMCRISPTPASRRRARVER